MNAAFVVRMAHTLWINIHGDRILLESHPRERRDDPGKGPARPLADREDRMIVAVELKRDSGTLSESGFDPLRLLKQPEYKVLNNFCDNN